MKINNHALQRTEAGVGVCSEYHVLLRQPLSLSLSSLGRFAAFPVFHWSETDLTEFFGALGIFHDDAASHEFSVSRDGLRLLFTLFSFEGSVYVSLYREGLSEPLFTVERRYCSHAQVVSEGSIRYLDVGSPAHPVSNPGFAPVLARGVRIQVEPQFSVRLIEPRHPATY